MIVDWWLSMMSGSLDWVLGLFGSEEPGGWLDNVGDLFNQIAGSAAGLGAWVSWSYFGAVVGSIVALWLTLWIIKGVRWLVAWVPTLGGS